MKNVLKSMVASKKLLRPTHQFMGSNTGSVLPFIALGIVLLAGATGTAIDMGRVQIVQTRMQTALDAAGVAIGTELSSTPTASLNQEAQKYFNANFPPGYMGSKIGTLKTTVSSDNTTITLTVSGTVSTTMMQLAGISTVNVSAASTTTRSQSGMELVLVVDNSGSMAQPAGGSDTKLAAAQNAIGIMLDILYGSTNGVKNDTNPNLWVGLVPFSQAVNIGLNHTGDSKHASWLDPIYANNLDYGVAITFGNNGNKCGVFTDSNGNTYTAPAWGGTSTSQNCGYNVPISPPSTNPTGALNGTPPGSPNGVPPGTAVPVIAAANHLAQWAGCVESRANGTTSGIQYDINDETPSTKPFKPYFYPSFWYLNNWYSTQGSTPLAGATGCQDANGNWINTNYPPSCVISYPTCKCGNSNDVQNCTDDPNCGQDPLVINPNDLNNNKCPYANYCYGKTVPIPYTYIYYGYGSNPEKYTGTNTSPNANCPSPMQQMVSSKATIMAAVNQMKPSGETEIDLGLAWAWRLLSPKWRGLWGGEMDSTGSQNPAFSVLPLDYNTPLMKKVVVLMTDGDNNILPALYSAYGQAWSNQYPVGSLGGGAPTPSVINLLGLVECDGTNTATSHCDAGNAELVKRTSTICTNMKNAGITIYTIALGTDISSTGKTLLKNCASNSSYYFNSPTTGQLKTAFQKIADTLTSLRVSQ